MMPAKISTVAIRLLFSLILGGMLAACGENKPATDSQTRTNDQASSSSERVTLRGELVYRERIALRPGLSATVALLDAGEQGREENVITEIQLSDFGQVPIAFSLTFPASAIKPEHDYLIRAALHDSDGNAAWRTAAPVEIDALDENTIHQIRLQQKRVNSVRTLHYDCGEVKFTAVVDDYSATLELKNRVVELPLVRAASGSKYSDGETVFWSKGTDKAFVVLNGETHKECIASS